MTPPPTAEPRKLVKARLRPDLYDQLDAYAQRTHRSLSSAAEHLIALGLRAEGSGPADDLHLR